MHHRHQRNSVFIIWRTNHPLTGWLACPGKEKKR